MLRRLAISLAATSALVLTATAPALADHSDPTGTFDGDEVDGGNLKTCEGLVEDALEDAGFDAELFWEESIDDVDSKDDVFDPPHPWFDLELSDDLTRLTVDAHSVPDGDFLVVLVKGGNATNVFIGPPFSEPLFAPVNDSDDHPEISNFTVCKFKGERPDDEDREDENREDEDEDREDETPSDEETPGEKETPEVKDEETPAAVPTAVPAGTSGSGDASMAPLGLAAAALMVVAGSAALIRRRFAHQN